MLALLRVMDANANRAREGLRVMEDAARFGMDDAGLSGGFKAVRHAVTLAVTSVGEAALLAARDTRGDVGVGVKVASEAVRADWRGACLAAGSRVGEALRAMEEAAKVMGKAEVAAACEKARYESYTLTQRLVQRLPHAEARQWTLCVLVSERLCTHLPWMEVAKAAIEGGADCVQLREKEMDGGELVRRARAMVEVARPRGASVVVNDRLDAALIADADGVHLGQTDLTCGEARRLADVARAGGRRLLVGVSTERVEMARAAFEAGADYVGLGPMFVTTTKDKPRLAGPGYVRQFRAEAGVGGRPHLAIGGITVGNVGEVAAAGARGVAVSSVVCGAKDPGAVCAGLVNEVRASHASVGP